MFLKVAFNTNIGYTSPSSFFLKVAFVAVCGLQGGTQAGGGGMGGGMGGGSSSSSSSSGGGGGGGIHSHSSVGAPTIRGLTVADFRTAADRCSDGEGSPLEYRFRLLRGLTLPELVRANLATSTVGRVRTRVSSGV